MSGNLTVFARLALAASSTSLSLLTSAPAHAAEDVTRTDVTGTYATDGSGDRNAAPIPVELLFPVATVDAMPPCLRTTPVGAEGCDQGTLKGAYEAVSAGAVGEAVSAGTASGESGGNVTLELSGGTYTVSVGGDPHPGFLDLLAEARADYPWASGLLAASTGGDAAFWGQQDTRSLPPGYLGEGEKTLVNGGDGGAINLTAGTDTGLRIVLDTTTLPALTAEVHRFALPLEYPDPIDTVTSAGGLVLQGVTALSRGGINGGYYTDGAFTRYKAYYSQPGDGGAVSVDFKGSIVAQGGYSSPAGPLILKEMGIAAMSIGGVLLCQRANCVKPQYEPGFNFEKPGRGGDVDVRLRGSSEIALLQGSAFGIFALSENGSVIQTSNGGEGRIEVDTGSLRAGAVDVTVEQGAAIRVGNSTAIASGGVLAISAGGGGGPLLGWLYDDPDGLWQDQNGNRFEDANNRTNLELLPGLGVGGTVTVTNSGVIEAEGTLAFGIGALSLSGAATVGFLIPEPGYLPGFGKNAGGTQGTLGTVTVTNNGSITTRGGSSHGIVAGSLGSGGLIYVELAGDEATRKAVAESCTVKYGETPDEVRANAALGEMPYCSAVETGASLGAAEGSSPANGGAVDVINHGTITTGIAGLPDASAYAMGVFAQSLGGGGGNASGGFLFWGGDEGGAGGSGGNVTLTNTGTVATYGDFSTAVLAQSVGGGGGVGGSRNFVVASGDDVEVREDTGSTAPATDSAGTTEGEVEVERGDPALGMFIVQDGAIELSMLGRSGNRYLCDMFTPGQTFGLIPAIDGGKTALTSSARGASTLLLIPRGIVLEAVSNNGPIAAALLITVARRARFLIDLIGNQITLPLDGRVANMLLVVTQFQSQDAGLGDPMELGFSQTDLADIAGISRQALGPILKSLEAAGIIALGYRSIRVLKPADLQARIEKSAG